MTRRAFLLTSSSGNNPSPIADLENLCLFLKSNFGGAWKEDEIMCGQVSEKQQVLKLIRTAEKSDYSLVYFIGNGEKVKDGLPWAEMKATLNSNETISEGELNPGSQRCTLILDCSGTVPRQPTTNEETPSENGGNQPNVRIVYDQHLVSAESGLVKVYATARAQGNRNLHSFTECLLSSTRKWLKDNNGILSLADTARIAQPKIGENGIQLEYLGGRRLRHFPFALRLL